MKKILYSLAIVAAFITQSVVAQLPANVQVSTGTTEHWYYIQNGSNPLMVSPVTNSISSNGHEDKAGMILTTKGGNGSTPVYSYVWNINQNQDLQLWKVVDAGSGNYFIVNKKTGNKLSLGTSTATVACENGDEINCSAFFYTNSDGNNSFKIKKIGDKSDYVTIIRSDAPTKILAANGADKKWAVNEYQMEDEYDIPANDVIMKDYKAWRFVSEAAMKARYPELSTEGNEKWYYIELLGTHANTRGRAVEARAESAVEGGYQVGYSTKAAATAANYNHQLWKFVAIPGDNSKIAIVNKALNKYYPYADAAKAEPFSATPVEFQFKNVNGDEVAIMPADNFRNSNGFVGVTFVANVYQLPGNMFLSTVNADQTSTRRYASTFKFTPVDGSNTGTPKVIKESFIVYVENGFIKVDGTNEPISVYTVNGIKVNPKKQLSRGIYIVRVGNKSQKVIVP